MCPGLVGISLDRSGSRCTGADRRRKRANSQRCPGGGARHLCDPPSRRKGYLSLRWALASAARFWTTASRYSSRKARPGISDKSTCRSRVIEVVGPDGGAGGLEGYIGVAALRRRYGSDVSAAVATFKGMSRRCSLLSGRSESRHAIYRPHHICLCGGIGIRLRHLLPVLREKIEVKLTSLARPGWTFTTGDDDFHAARGAAALAGIRIGADNL